MKKLPKELHKKRVLLFIDPFIIDKVGKEKCKDVAKKSINNEYKKTLRNEK
jgi:hypothetical protein